MYVPPLGFAKAVGEMMSNGVLVIAFNKDSSGLTFSNGAWYMVSMTIGGTVSMILGTVILTPTPLHYSIIFL